MTTQNAAYVNEDGNSKTEFKGTTNHVHLIETVTLFIMFSARQKWIRYDY